MHRNFRSLGHPEQLFSLFLLLLLSGSLFAASPTPLPAPAPAEQLFKERTFGPLPPPTQTPGPRRFEADEEPIPRGWVIGGIAAALLVVGATLYGSARAWRSSNLFDREYRFPENSNPALRLGGSRCGGHMATINVGHVSQARATSSNAKDV
jgi:hypothetical protein